MNLLHNSGLMEFDIFSHITFNELKNSHSCVVVMLWFDYISVCGVCGHFYKEVALPYFSSHGSAPMQCGVGSFCFTFLESG